MTAITTLHVTAESVDFGQALFYLAGQVFICGQILSLGHPIPVSYLQHHLLDLLLCLGHDAQPGLKTNTLQLN